MTSKVEVEKTVKGYEHRLRILVNDLPHLILVEPVLAIQAWIDKKLFVIDYRTATGSTLTEYDDRELWAAILRRLGELY